MELVVPVSSLAGGGAFQAHPNWLARQPRGATGCRLKADEDRTRAGSPVRSASTPSASRLVRGLAVWWGGRLRTRHSASSAEDRGLGPGPVTRLAGRRDHLSPARRAHQLAGSGGGCRLYSSIGADARLAVRGISPSSLVCRGARRLAWAGADSSLLGSATGPAVSAASARMGSAPVRRTESNSSAPCPPASPASGGARGGCVASPDRVFVVLRSKGGAPSERESERRLAGARRRDSGWSDLGQFAGSVSSAASPRTIGLVRQRAVFCVVAGSVCRERTAGSSSGKQGAQAPGARFSSDRLLRAAVLRSHGPFRSARRLAGGQVNGSGAHDPSQLAGQRSQLRGWTDAGAQVPCPACREGAAVNGSSPSVRRRRNPSPLHELRPGAAHCLVRRATRRSKRLERAPSGDREGRAPNPVSCSQLGWEMEPAAESWFPWMTGSLHTDDERAPPSRIPPLGEGQARWLPRMASSEVPGVGRPDQRIRTSSLAPLAVRYVARRPPRAAVLPGSPGSDGRSFGAAFRSSDRFARVRGGRRGTGSLAPLPTSREMT
jgi:hypothetical protein